MIEITRAQAKAILDYLMQQPYGEVCTAVEWITSAMNTEASAASNPADGTPENTPLIP